MSVCDVLDNRLVVSFANQAKGTYSVDFYNLPFEKFEKAARVQPLRLTRFQPWVT